MKIGVVSDVQALSTAPLIAASSISVSPFTIFQNSSGSGSSYSVNSAILSRCFSRNLDPDTCLSCCYRDVTFSKNVSSVTHLAEFTFFRILSFFLKTMHLYNSSSDCLRYHYTGNQTRYVTPYLWWHQKWVMNCIAALFTWCRTSLFFIGLFLSCM